MLIDTHTHLIDRYIPADELPGVLARAADAGVEIMICPSADPADPADIIKLIESHKNIYGMIGIHPHYSANASASASFLDHPKIVAVGEIGLDYYYNKDTRDEQKKLFRQQMELARIAALPVAIHTRDAAADTIEILREFPEVFGVMHFYTGSWETAKILLDMGYYFSAAGVMTFKNAGAIRDVFARLPIDKIVVETDAPYSAPVPYRGKTCEPAMMIETVKTLAEIRNIPRNELEKNLFENTKKLFPKLQI